MNLARITFFLLFIGFNLCNGDLFGQCPGKIDISKKSPGVDGQNNGFIELAITASNTYSIKLMQLDGGSEKVVSRRQRVRERTITFNNLSPDLIYKVIIDFDGEEKFVCQTKVITDIVLNTRGN